MTGGFDDKELGRKQKKIPMSIPLIAGGILALVALKGVECAGDYVQINNDESGCGIHFGKRSVQPDLVVGLKPLQKLKTDVNGDYIPNFDVQADPNRLAKLWNSITNNTGSVQSTYCNDVNAGLVTASQGKLNCYATKDEYCEDVRNGNIQDEISDRLCTQEINANGLDMDSFWKGFESGGMLVFNNLRRNTNLTPAQLEEAVKIVYNTVEILGPQQFAQLSTEAKIEATQQPTTGKCEPTRIVKQRLTSSELRTECNDMGYSIPPAPPTPVEICTKYQRMGRDAIYSYFTAHDEVFSRMGSSSTIVYRTVKGSDNKVRPSKIINKRELIASGMQKLELKDLKDNYLRLVEMPIEAKGCEYETAVNIRRRQ